MTARFLTTLNFIGCLVLVGLITVQWNKELRLQSAMASLAKQRDTAHQEIKILETRRFALERDITALKEALASTQQAAESSASELSAKAAVAQQQQADLAAAHTQVESWQLAIQERDTRITTLQSELEKLRARLDEAIAKLKQAGAR